MRCAKCNGNSHHTRLNKESHEWLCLECYGREEMEIHGGIRVFEPYVLRDGPMDTIPDTDPNKVIDTESSRFADGVYLKNRSEERRYMNKLGLKHVEKGEKVMGIRAEMKERPTKKLYFFQKG